MKTVPAPPPFDNADANVILRSSDKEPVDFRAFKLLLSLSSPFFAEVFTLPQPNTPSAWSEERLDGAGRAIPVVQMSEDSTTLHLLLGLCLPISIHETPRFSSLQDLQKVAEAALKFEMEGVLKYLRGELVTPRFIESQPLRVFAIAYRYGWDAEARKAARYTLRHSIDIPFVSELEFISGATLYRLQEYHRMCGEVASSRAMLQPALAEDDDHWTWITCKRCPAAWSVQNNTFPDARKWWVEWVEGIAQELQAKPWGETVRKWDLHEKALAKASDCPKCGKQAREDMEAFSLLLSIQVERDVSSVELDLNFDDWSQCTSPTT
ncbi:hypothetical protein GALMADRAFT_241323 [Galerina marginata CBS 339.88]|uniref:BTB domain-containing protein n=1 Tax=Galerina marginata (strain CBS 339.88) TaxID=685588 RepID=A0A067TC95_GALM3|nr:hypothetical protein GALMADRAFT_241323 [Galerina marginata CBS 339.88]